MRAIRSERQDDAPPTAAETETLHDCLRKLVQLLPAVTRGMRRRPVPAGLREAKLGPRHGVALSLLSQHGPLTMGALASGLGLTLPTVSGLVADVEQAGFVQRSADPADRRRTFVTLVPQHNEALDVWLDGATAPMARALGKLSHQERLTFLKAMTCLEAELNDDARLDAPGSPGPESSCS